MQPAITCGIHHLGLSVMNVDETVDFFVRQLNYTVVGGNESYPAVFVSDGTVMLTFWQTKNTEPCRTFDRHRNVGLHHVALRVASKTALEELHEQLAALPDVTFEFCPEALGDTELRHMMCIIPGGLRVEFIAE